MAVATLRDIPDAANIKFSWLPWKENIADHLTKAGTNSQRLINILAGVEELPMSFAQEA